MNDDVKSVDSALDDRRTDIPMFIALALVFGVPADASAALCLVHALH